MTCERCYRPMNSGEHGLYLCPMEPRRAATVRPDSIPGGLLISHGLCNEDGSPRRYDSHSEIDLECQKRNLVRWTDVYEESRTRDGKDRAAWFQSGEARRERAERVELRRQKAARVSQ